MNELEQLRTQNAEMAELLERLPVAWASFDPYTKGSLDDLQAVLNQAAALLSRIRGEA